jgi:hypothetical protein
MQNAYGGNIIVTPPRPPVIDLPPPMLMLQRQGMVLTLTWSGAAVLQAADTVLGPWADVPGASSPFTMLTTAPAKFFRLKPVM